MIPVNKEIAKIIKGNNRKYFAGVSFSFLSCKVPQAIKIQAPNAQDYSVPDQIVFPYLYHIANRFFVSSKKEINSVMGNRIFPTPQNVHKSGKLQPVSKRPYSHIGYIGLKADEAGDVNDTIKLYIPRTNTKKITIRTNDDRIIIDGTVIAKTSANKIIKKIEIKNNSLSELVLDLEAERVGILELTITKHTANRRVWIISFYPGFEFLVDEKDIVKIKHQKKKTENKDGSIGRVYINSLTMELNNITRLYDNQNVKSPIAGYFNSNAICSCAITLKHKTNSKPFVLDLGSFFVSEIKVAEDKATVTVKAQDYIGFNKSKYLSLGIEDKTTAYTCFSKIANELNLNAIKIDKHLKEIKLERIPLNGTAGSLLNKLAVLTNAFVSIDETGAALIATPILSRHGSIRYPSRYFFLDEYKPSNTGEKKNKTPNVINLAYNTYEYEGEYQAGRKDVLMYEAIPQLDFPETYKTTPFMKRPIGAGIAPSITREYDLTAFEKFITIEFSDPLIPKVLEYTVEYEYETSTTESNAKPIKATVRIWNFIERNVGEQLTVMLMVMQEPLETLLKKDEFQIPKSPRTYIAPLEDASLITSDANAVENRNSKNQPVEFKIELKDAVKIARVEVANLFLQCKFEFAYRKTSEGITVKVWNYLNYPQTVTVNIYGSRLVAGKEKKTITARNNDDIQVNGEIIKNIEVGSLADDDIARNVLTSMAYYYRHFQTDFSVQTWSDPRLQLYDIVAFKSLRGYGFMQGIIDELEIEYKGYLTQKLKIKQTKKHNRDCRVLNSFILKDRPVMAKTFLKYV